MGLTELRVDHERHVLHFDGRTFSCDRDVEAAHRWYDCALLLSSDTDCLSLWDGEGIVRTARVGVYPQDFAVQEDRAIVCGGADGKLHLLTLPDLVETEEYPVPGMPERLCLRADAAYVLTLIPEPEVHTMLMRVDLSSGQWRELRRFAGIPEAIAAEDSGLRVVVSEGTTRLADAELGT